ncbi:PDR/VanB family oxidoreductase [Paraburkholderia sp. SIMBA_030]|uniref:PDR/VanB family oxidoreductase n=1 Tax=Paraburkholderia sp. SIMBA_030 TaxID=3085773 RepID=UPI00397AA6D5
MLEVLVSQKKLEADDVYSFELKPTFGKVLPRFSAGAHIDVHVAPGVIRQYSLCNSPLEQHRYVIGVLDEPASRGGSRAMHEEIMEGHSLQISEPRNMFPLKAAAEKHLLFAGGIGITPIISMAYELLEVGADFEIHYCARAPERAAFVEQIKDSGLAAKVQFHFDQLAPAQKLDARAVLADPRPDVHIYVCGPGGFIEYILGTARSCGWSDGQLHREYFAAPEVADAVDDSFEVEISGSGLVLKIPKEKTVVEVLRSAGIDIPTSCDQGICGSCLTPVLQGIPDHRDQIMSDAEHARNDQFTPCCSRAKSRRLVLQI